MVYDLYPHPQFLKLCEHIDTTGIRYLNQNHTPLVNLIYNTLNIEVYYEKRFNKPLSIPTPPCA